MGKGVHERFEADHPKVIDYALSDQRSDFLDVWLMANTFFAVSTGTGLDTISTVYKRPVVYLDYIPINFIVVIIGRQNQGV